MKDIYYADSFEYNSISKYYTNNLKIEDDIKKLTISIQAGYDFFKRKKNTIFFALGFEKNIKSSNTRVLSNKDYYHQISREGVYQDFENITLGVKRDFGKVRVSIPLVFESSYNSVTSIIWYKEIFFYYKTGLIISF